MHVVAGVEWRERIIAQRAEIYRLVVHTGWGEVFWQHTVRVRVAAQKQLMLCPSKQHRATRKLVDIARMIVVQVRDGDQIDVVQAEAGGI